MTRLFRLLGALGLTALALSLYARAEWPWIALGFVALVPWLGMLDRLRSLGTTLKFGFAMSIAYVLTLFYWLPSAVQDLSGAPWALCLLAVALAAPLLAPQFLALALARRLALTSGMARRMPFLVALTSACAWVAADWAMPKLLSDTLGIPLYGSTWLRQGADVAGVLGLTFVVLLVNECVLVILRQVRITPPRGRSLLRPVACLAGLILVPLGYGALRHHQFTHLPAADSVTVGLVQAGFSHYDRVAAELGTYLTVRTVLDSHIAHTRRMLHTTDLDLVVWPETVYPLTFGAPQSVEGAAFDRRIEELVWRTGVPLVFGGYDEQDGRLFNAAFFLEPTDGGGVRVDTYRKTRLFPLTERVPAVLDHDFVRSRMPWLGNWSAGSGHRVLPVVLANGRTVQIAPLICYDAFAPALAVAAVRDGAEIILTLSNDSWFEYGNMPRLALIISAFRSIETRRPQLRATNTGSSALITATGEFVALLDTGERGVLQGSVTPGAGTTLQLRLGDWFGPTALAMTLLLLGLALASRQEQPGH